MSDRKLRIERSPELQQSPEYSAVPPDGGVSGVDGQHVPLGRPQHWGRTNQTHPVSMNSPPKQPPKTAPQNPGSGGSGGSGGSAVVTCSSEADEHGGGVEAPDAGLDEHGDVRAGDQTDTTSATTERTTRLNPVNLLSPVITVQQSPTRRPH